jgi:hypothetical protein
LQLCFIARSNLRNAVLMRIAHHPGHAGKCGNLLRRALGIAARNHDFCRWIFTMDTADRSAGILVCGGGDSTSIQDYDVGFPRRMGLCQALCRKLAFQGRSIGLSGAAAKTLDKKSRHERYYNWTSEEAGAAAAHNQYNCWLHPNSAIKAIQRVPWSSHETPYSFG